MVAKKKGKLSTTKAKEKKEVGFEIGEYAHQIWLAGLGALSKAQVEGPKMFDSLVREGKRIQKANVKAVEEGIDKLQKEVESGVKKVKGEVTDTWDKLEKVFQDRVSRSLHQLGVPTSDEIKILTKKVDELSKAVHGMAKTKPTTVKRTTAPTTAKKTTKKTVTHRAA